MSSIWDEAELVSEEPKKDIWAEAEEVQQPQPQPKNVVPNRPANQELKVEEPTQEVKSDFQLNATKNYTQEMGADGRTYLVDENGNRVVNNDLSGIEKFKRKGQAFLSNLGDYINAAPGTEQWKDKAKKLAFAESMFIPGSIGAKGALGWALGGGLGAGTLTAGENLIDEGKINPVQTTANAIIGALSGGSLYGIGKGAQFLYNNPTVRKVAKTAVEELVPGVRRYNINKRKAMPLVDRMTPEQLERATTPDVVSDYGVANIDSARNKAIAEQMQANIETENALMNEYKQLHSETVKKYGNIDNLKAQAVKDLEAEQQYGQVSEALRDYRNLIDYENTLADAKYVSTNIKNSVTRDNPVVQNVWGNTKDVKQVKQMNKENEALQNINKNLKTHLEENKQKYILNNEPSINKFYEVHKNYTENAPEIYNGEKTFEGVLNYLGSTDGKQAIVKTPLEDVTFNRNNLKHIIIDHPERLPELNKIIKTLETPNMVVKTVENGKTYRNYIKNFAENGKNKAQFEVIKIADDGNFYTTSFRLNKNKFRDKINGGQIEYDLTYDTSAMQKFASDNNIITNSVQNFNPLQETNNIKLSKLNQSDLGKEVNSQATYDVLHNKDLINQGTVEATKEGAYGNLLGRTLNPKEEMSALDFETGRQLATKLLSEGKTQDALNLIEGLANKASKAGQAVQALSLWSKITPEGAIAQAEKIINNYNKNATKKLPKLTEQQAQDILKLQENIMNQTDDRARDIATAQLLKYQAELIPQSGWQKVKTLRNISLLLNPKTLVRNIVGNGTFAINEVGAKALADIIDTGFSKFSGTKTRSMPKLNAMWQGLKQGTKEGIEDVSLGIDTRGGIGARYDLPNTRSFRGGNKERMQLSEVLGSDNKVDATLQYLKDAVTKNRVGQAISQKSFKPLKKIGGDLGNYLETALDYGLRVPDRTFYQGVYNESVANQLAAKGLKEITPEIEERARQEALEAVFQNDGKISNTVLGLRRALNKIGNKDFGLGDWLIPYAQTPANLVQQGINYSPLGFIKAALNKGDQRQASLDIARALIGSGLMGGGYALAKNGIGQGAVDDYQERKNLEAEGIRPFTINGVSFNQIQPNAVPLTAGMALANPSSKGALNDALETITDLSMLDSLKQFNKDRENYGTVNAGLRQLAGLPSQFVGTGVNQINAFIDPYQRETYDPNIAKQGLNKLMAKIPGLSYVLPKATDVKGEEIKKYADSPNTLAKINDVFLNPVFINKKKNNPVMQEVIRLNSDANKTLLPIAEKKLKFTLKDGTEFNKTLTSKEYVAYKNKLGKEVYNNLAELMNTEFYQNADDLQKANLINKLQKDVKDRVQQDIFNKASKKDKPKISKYERKKKQYLNKQLKNFIDDNYGEE